MKDNPINQQKFRLFFLIVPPKLSLKAEEIYQEYNIPEQYYVFAKGTATGDIVNMLGLGDIDKTVTIAPMPAHVSGKVMAALQNELYLGTPGSGIAFTIPLNAGSAGILHLLQALEETETLNDTEDESMKTDHSMILAFVNQGYSEEVMAAAKSAGAGGGTVFHTRRVESDDAAKFWGISIQEEREIVLILSRRENKVAIMNAISEKCGSHSDAHGIVISLPVDEVAGLRKEIQ